MPCREMLCRSLRSPTVDMNLPATPLDRNPTNPSQNSNMAQTHLVLAVAVTSRGTTGHFDCWKRTSCETEGVVVEKKVVSGSKKKGIQAAVSVDFQAPPLTSGKTLSPSQFRQSATRAEMTHPLDL